MASIPYTLLYSQKKPTFENNDLRARGDFSVNPATFYHFLGILVLIAQSNFFAQPVNQIYEAKYCLYGFTLWYFPGSKKVTFLVNISLISNGLLKSSVPRPDSPASWTSLQQVWEANEWQKQATLLPYSRFSMPFA